MRWVLCWYGRATVNRFDAGSIPASAAYETEGQARPPFGRCPRRQPSRGTDRPMAGLVGSSVTTLRVQLPLLPLYFKCSWPSGKGSRLPTWLGGFDSHRALFLIGDGLTVRCLALNQAMKVRLLLPEPFGEQTCHKQLLRGRLTARRGALLRLDVGSIPAPAAQRKSSGRMRSLS